MTDFKLAFSWDTYQKSICNGLGLLQQRGEFVDMTIAADGHFVKVHQLVLSLVSPYIKEILSSTPSSSHPVIFLNKVSSYTLQSILEYAYTGEVMVSKDRLTEFVEACTALRIKGLENDNIQFTSVGSFLNAIERSSQETAQRKETTDLEQPAQISIKRIKMPDKENDNNSHDDDVQPFHVSQMDDDHLDRSDDDADWAVLPENRKKAPEERGTSDLAPKSVIQYSLSCQGSVQLVLNRFIYRLRHARRNKQVMWRCADYNKKGCAAFAFTQGDVVIERGCAHNHPFHDKQILKKIQKGNMFTAYNSAAAMASTKKDDTGTSKEDST